MPYESELNGIVDKCQEVISEHEDQLDQAEAFINYLFIDQLFIDRAQSQSTISSFSIAEGIAQRKLFPILKSAVIAHIARECGFEADCVFVPSKVMTRIICDQHYAIIFDPKTGESINYAELDQRMEDSSLEQEQHYLSPLEARTLVVEYLTACKQLLIEQGKFESALKCIDLLITLKPDSPEERVERGFLLHQLDCFKVACDDYRYFVEQCPEDPAAQLLKQQLEKIKINNTILH